MGLPNIKFQRIPVTFIFDAPESIVGRVFQTALGGAGAVSTYAIAKTLSVIPGLGADNLPSITDTLKNKIVLPMLVNPNTISVSKNPTVNRTLTKRGILNQFWQAEPDQVSFQGRAAGDRAFFILSQIDALMQTMENGTRNRVTMIFKFGGVYTGYFLNFRTQGDSMQPGVFDYSFDFQFTDARHFRLFLYAIKPSALNEAIQSPGRFVTEQLKLGASELGSTSGISFTKPL